MLVCELKKMLDDLPEEYKDAIVLVPEYQNKELQTTKRAIDLICVSSFTCAKNAFVMLH